MLATLQPHSGMILKDNRGQKKIFPVNRAVSSAPGYMLCVKGELAQYENIYDSRQWPIALPSGSSLQDEELEDQ